MKTAARFILETLERIQPYALPQSALRVEVNAKVRPPMDERPFEALLVEMRQDGLTAKLCEKYEDEPKWLITEAGKVFLRQ